MDKVTTLIYERQPESLKRRESKARGGKFAYEVAAQRGAKLVGRKLSTEQRKKIGGAIHWSLGVTSGALYGLIRNRSRLLGIGSGVAYGLAFYVLVDEAGLATLGISPPPNAFRWQTHARGLAGHLVLGGILDGVFDVADLAASARGRFPTTSQAVDRDRS
jgi:hypothetical protein